MPLPAAQDDYRLRQRHRGNLEPPSGEPDGPNGPRNILIKIWGENDIFTKRQRKANIFPRWDNAKCAGC